MKKKVVIVIATIACLIVVGVGSLLFMFRHQYAAAQSVKQVGDKMYTMTYEGDYGLEEFLEQGGATSPKDIAAFVCNHLFCKPKLLPLPAQPTRSPSRQNNRSADRHNYHHTRYKR